MINASMLKTMAIMLAFGVIKMKTNEIIARLEDMRFKLESQIINCENLLAELVDEDR